MSRSRWIANINGLRALFLFIVLAGVSGQMPPALIDSPADLARFTRSNNALAFDIYGLIRNRPGNIAVSPLAITSAVVMLWAGARGETEAQIRSVLRAGGTSEQALATAGQIAKSLAAPERKFTFRAGNRLFIDTASISDAACRERAARSFGVLCEPADFGSAGEASQRRINDWVSKITENRIRGLLPPGAVGSATAMVIANALYFRGHWKTRFSEQSTWPERFHRAEGDFLDVPMMHLDEGFFRSVLVDGVAVLELPYEGDEVAMTLVLPEAGRLSEVEARLSAATLGRWTAALETARLRVTLPRFEITPRLALGESLKTLGMTAPFDPDRADFTAIARKGVFARDLFHKVYLKVDETGTEAAAGGWGSFGKRAPDEFRADAPFLFFIREVRSGLILFMGRISDPSVGVDEP